MNVVALISRRFRTDVCSAYALEPDRANLGALPRHSDCVAVRWHHSGWRCTKASPDWSPNKCDPSASRKVRKHPRFKFFGEAGEEEATIRSSAYR